VVAKIFARKEGPVRFALPLAAPASPLPEGRDFGSKRIFNGKPAGQPHMGADYTIPQGTHAGPPPMGRSRSPKTSSTPATPCAAAGPGSE
jgi:hypothetical protein